MHRRAAVIGAVLLALVTVAGICAPAIMAPQPPWYDVEAQQDHQFRMLLVFAVVFASGGGMLLTYAFVAMRIAARAQKARMAPGRARLKT